MSDNEQHDPTPQLTRRQLRELRNTASNPIITGETPVSPDQVEVEPAPAPSAPLPRAAEPVIVPDPPVADASVDLGARALTRRQARQQEKIRTASIPIIAPESAADAAPAAAPDDAPSDTADAISDGDAAAGTSESPELIDGPPTPVADADAEADADAPVEAEASTADEPVVDTTPDVEVEAAPEAEASEAPSVDDDARLDDLGLTASDETGETDDAATERHVVSEELGAALLSGSTAAADLPPSFDQLLSRSAAATGAFTAPNALILAQNPDAGPLVAPITATGELLVTGTFSLPDRFGSTGVVPGSADGSEVDAVLVDGELPASSSPTPIAASAAISTIKSAEDVIRPPAPEKGSRIMIFLAITAGVLAAALAGVLIVALASGAIS